MKKLLSSIFILAGIGISGQVLGQTTNDTRSTGTYIRPQYNMYMHNMQAFNPSFSSADSVGRVSALARFQWVGVVGAPQTQLVTAYTPLKNQTTSLGFTFINDKYGVTQQTGAGITLAQRVRLSETGYLAAGFSVGAENYTENLISVPKAGTSTDDPFFQNNVREWRANLGLGITYFTSSFMFAVSAPYVYQYAFDTNEGDPNKSRFAMSDFYVTSSYKFRLDNGMDLKPAVMVKYGAQQPLGIDVNLNALLTKNLWLGVGYRTSSAKAQSPYSSAFIAMFQVDLDRDFQLGYSADFSTNTFYKQQSAGHEILLSYKFGRRQNASFNRNEGTQRFN